MVESIQARKPHHAFCRGPPDETRDEISDLSLAHVWVLMSAPCTWTASAPTAHPASAHRCRSAPWTKEESKDQTNCWTICNEFALVYT
jgi:hypothetical protein